MGEQVFLSDHWAGGSGEWKLTGNTLNLDRQGSATLTNRSETYNLLLDVNKRRSKWEKRYHFGWTRPYFVKVSVETKNYQVILEPGQSHTFKAITTVDPKGRDTKYEDHLTIIGMGKALTPVTAEEQSTADPFKSQAFDQDGDTDEGWDMMTWIIIMLLLGGGIGGGGYLLAQLYGAQSDEMKTW